MKFIKDIVLFDIETTGPDPDKDPMIQLSAVLLDKDNLLEKDFYNSYIRVSLLDNTINQHAALLQIPFDALKQSPKVHDVIKQFSEKFDSRYLLAAHTFQPVLFLKNAFKKVAIPFEYNMHTIDLWTLGYLYTLNFGIKKMPTFNTFVDQFSLQQQNKHNALEKARLSAEIFRRISKDV
jgi:DNA polymerase III alpha subunit (gram-positive type)